MIRTRFAACFLLSILLGNANAEVQPPFSRIITVRLYNLAEVRTTELARAKSEASGIFERVGVRLLWLNCGGPNPEARCFEISGPEVLNLRLLPSQVQARERPAEHVFGFALMSADGDSATIANIYYDRVSEISDGRKFRRAVVLGAIMAHELGHLLLGVNSHSKMGLMAFPWGPKLLLAADRGMLGFSKDEAIRIRQGAQARLSETERARRAGL